MFAPLTTLIKLLSTFSQQFCWSSVLLIGIPITFTHICAVKRILHKKSLVKAAALTVLACLLFSQVEIFGAKGGGKDKKGYVLRFSGFENRISFQNKFLHQPGVFYKGSLNMAGGQQNGGSSIITFQKGNTIYLMPYKYKTPLSKFKTPEKPNF
jgi:hypothetical protein